MSKHTPGPWYVDGDREVRHSGDGDQLVADVNFYCGCEGDSYDDEQAAANARLIAAAPELLEACKSALLLCDGANPAHEAVYHQLNTAINKAELP